VSSNKNNEIEEKKDVFYRAKKNPKINWRSALWAFAKQFLSVVEKNSCSADSAYKCSILFWYSKSKGGRQKKLKQQCIVSSTTKQSVVHSKPPKQKYSAPRFLKDCGS
jgi:hypothetical protein